MAASTLFVLFSVLLLLSPLSSSARVLSHFHSQSSMATEPSLNIMLQQPNSAVAVSDSDRVLSPCEGGPASVSSPGGQQEKQFGKYGRSIVLNVLPKGKVPPSGPSKGTNSVNV